MWTAGSEVLPGTVLLAPLHAAPLRTPAPSGAPLPGDSRAPRDPSLGARVPGCARRTAGALRAAPHLGPAAPAPGHPGSQGSAPPSAPLTGAAAAPAASLRKLAAPRESGRRVTAASLPPGGAANQRRVPGRARPSRRLLPGPGRRGVRCGGFLGGPAASSAPHPQKRPSQKHRLLHGVWQGHLGCHL